MAGISVKQKILLTGVCVLFSLSAFADGNVLWRIVHDKCVPSQKQANSPAPCDRVDIGQGEEQGYAVLKDLKGDLQYLLIPTGKVTGIESTVLLDAKASDYWGEAWKARSFMSKKHGSEVPRDTVALAINSQKGRSQNQLHIHISCVRKDVRYLLGRKQNEIGSSWSELAGGVSGHPYLARWIEGSEMVGVYPFRKLAEEVSSARENMGDYTIAVVGAKLANGKEGFYLLAGKADPSIGIEGSAEDDVQDHECHVL